MDLQGRNADREIPAVGLPLIDPVPALHPLSCPSVRPATSVPALLLLPLLVFTVWLYWPGLDGPFLFDDFPNLAGLSNFGGVHDWESLKQYVLTGIAGPTGRPLALLSFLIDDNAWPSNPHSFKYTNLLLHLLTGLLLLVVLRQLLQRLPQAGCHADAIALAVTAFWLLHPLNVSTVLYVVQRMAILSALFSLLATTGYLHGRNLLATAPRRAHVWMGLSLFFGTLAAVLSKENGALTPILVLVLEITILRATAGPRPHRLFSALFLWLPLFGLCSYFFLLWLSGDLASGYGNRSFTLYERLLTQARALWEYIGWWLIPRPGQRGLYADDYLASQSLLAPWTTLPALIGLLLATVLAIHQRRRQPLFAAAVLYFLAGHLLESTVIPLELYFEHRNYQPAMLLVLPLITSLLGLSARLRTLLLVVILALPTAVLAWQVSIWKDSVGLALYWARIHPESMRAETAAESILHHIGRSDLALEYNARARIRHPQDLTLAANALLLKCSQGEVDESTYTETLQVFRNGRYDYRIFDHLRTLVVLATDHGCRGLDAERTRLLLAALLDNPEGQGPNAKRQGLHLIGLLEIKQGRGESGFEWFTRSQSERPDPDIGLLEVATLATYGWLDLALRHLDRVEAGIRAGARGPTSGLDYLLAAERLRKQIGEASRMAGSSPSSLPEGTPR